MSGPLRGAYLLFLANRTQCFTDQNRRDRQLINKKKLYDRVHGRPTPADFKTARTETSGRSDKKQARHCPDRG